MGETIRFRRVRFSTRLPVDVHYSPSHCWIGDELDGLRQVGFTAFAVRMLGDLVEFQFKLNEGDPIEVGQTIGWIEGFKAISDLYAVLPGTFAGSNPALDKDITLFDNKHYREGWLYRVRAQALPELMDVHEYIGLLDATIDRMLAEEQRD